jgi:hypothetical protein
MLVRSALAKGNGCYCHQRQIVGGGGLRGTNREICKHDMALPSGSFVLLHPSPEENNRSRDHVTTRTGSRDQAPGGAGQGCLSSDTLKQLGEAVLPW